MDKKKKNIVKIGIVVGLIPVVFILTVIIITIVSLQRKKELMGYKNANASVVLSMEGELIGKIFTENRTNVTFDRLPDHLIKALIATEDIRFYEHRGTDSRSLLRVFFKTILFNRQTGGGSTITQQLAKNMFGRKRKGAFSILFAKTRESFLAHRLEKIFTKDEILTMYLNTVPFGENVYGIEAASLRYFNKNVENLRTEESAVLVGMLKANNLYNPRLNPGNSLLRRNVVLSQMQKYKFLSRHEADSLRKMKLVLNYSNLETEGPADYFLYQVRKEAEAILEALDSTSGQKYNIEQDGLIINTTLSLKIQTAANKAFRKHLSVMQKRLKRQYSQGSYRKSVNLLVINELERLNLTDKANTVALRQVFDWEGSHADSISVLDSLRQSILLLHAGLIAIDPATGAVLAWAGGIHYKLQPYDQILARRQMGSTFKPILYATAFEQGLRPCDYLANDSIIISGEEDYIPRNYDHTYGGKYSLTGALVHSMNVPSFNLFVKVGFDSLNRLWQNMGFSFKLDNTPSLPLGTAEANLQEVAAAYAVFSNGGYTVKPYKIISIENADGQVIWKNELSGDKRYVLSENAVTYINVILQKAVTEGTGSAIRSVYGLNMPLAGKTGTSQDYTDAWFAAYNPRLVVISRVGASMPSVHFNNSAYGSGSALALPLVALTLTEIQKNADLKRFIAFFPPLIPEIERLMSCPDYKEDTDLDNFLELFRRDRIIYDEKNKRMKRKGSFFKDLFRRRN
jgi:penicillin-binding protein 1A